MTDFASCYKMLAARRGAFVLLCLFFVILATAPVKTALACHSCSCVNTQHTITRALIKAEHIATRIHITSEFKKQQKWITDDFYRGWIAPAWMMLTEQLSAVGMQQMMILGAFLDAKQQMEVQRLFDKLAAQAHKDYNPSVELCYIGTTARSLYAAERRGEFNAIVMTRRSQDRQMGNLNSLAAGGPDQDRDGRIKQFIKYYCDKADNRGHLESLCTDDSIPTEDVNKDIDFTRTVDYARTLDVDFSDNNLTNDERTVMAMASYLFAHDVFDRPDKTAMRTTDGRDNLMDIRSVVAKRSVAENSFNALVGLKSRGGDNSADEFMAALLKDMGVSNDDAMEIVGTDPSYFAQLEWMARKIYQRPEFYTDLYDKPANILRKNVAMQAIGLMVDRDTYRSDLRSEALFAVLLELEIARLQEDVQNRIGFMDPHKKRSN